MESIIGIDFGTTNSEVAALAGAAPRVLSNAEGMRVIPSAVYLDDDGRIYVGQAARNVAVLHPERSILAVKRELGSDRRYRINGREYSPEQIASFLFSHLRKSAEQKLGGEVRKTVVTVPAYFDDVRRQATKKAAALAGLEIVRLLNEPTAAALAYGIEGRQPGTILVYDLGGGTFDVSLLRAGEGVFQVLATRGNTRVGGVDFDRRIAGLLLERFQEETGIDLRRDRLAMHKVLQNAEAAKIQLSRRNEADIEIPFITATRNGPCHLVSRVTREEFEGLIAGYVECTLRLTRGVLKDAGLAARQIDRILMVGGSTRIPAVRRAVEALFGKPIDTDIPPEEAVVCGAALQAGILAGGVDRMVLVDVVPLSLGVETADKKMVTLVRRNAVLPASAKAVFTTVTDYQQVACIKVLQGERRRSEDNTHLGFIRLNNLQQARRGEPDIEVRFEIDVEGIVHVYVRDLKTGSFRAIDITGAARPGRDEVREQVVEARAAELEDLYDEWG